MAKARGKTGARRRTRGRRHVLPALLLALLLPGCLLGWMYAGAVVVHVRPAEVFLPDLPPQFDGVTALYLSDLDIRSAREAAATARLMDALEELSPDLLLLGGDYSAGTLLDALNRAKGGEAHAAEFLRTLVNFRAPLGKLAVLGETDTEAALMDAFAMAGFLVLRDSAATIERDGAKLTVLGLRDISEDVTPYDELARSFRAEECVLVLAHNPLAYTRIRTTEARNGGAWADLVLSGHTLGGQIRLLGRTLRSFSEEGARRIAGWYYADDLPALVSQGLGCRDAKLRLGTQSEVWLLTLRRPARRNVEN